MPRAFSRLKFGIRALRVPGIAGFDPVSARFVANNDNTRQLDMDTLPPICARACVRLQEHGIGRPFRLSPLFPLPFPLLFTNLIHYIKAPAINP